MPAIAQLTAAFGFEAFDGVRTTLSLTPIDPDFPANRERSGRVAVDRPRPGLAAAIAGWFKVHKRPLWAHVFTAVALAAGIWLALSIIARITMPLIKSQGARAEDVPSLTAWAMARSSWGARSPSLGDA